MKQAWWLLRVVMVILTAGLLSACLAVAPKERPSRQLPTVAPRSRPTWVLPVRPTQSPGSRDHPVVFQVDMDAAHKGTFWTKIGSQDPEVENSSKAVWEHTGSAKSGDLLILRFRMNPDADAGILECRILVSGQEVRKSVKPADCNRLFYEIPIRR